MKQSHTLVGLLAALALTSTACGVTGLGTTHPETPTVARAPELAPGQHVSIVFESYNFGLAGPWTDTFNTLLAQFHETHPDITVTPQKPQGNAANPATDAISSVQNQSATGNPPDVAQLTFDALNFASNQLRAKPLDDLVGHDEVQANFQGTRHPYEPHARTLGDVRGKTYGVPFVFSTPVLYYNASLFEQAGLDPAKPPATWEEVQQDAQAIKDRTGKDGAYIDCLTKEAKDWCYQSLVRSNGGSVISADSKRLTFAEPPATGAVKMAQGLVNTGVMPKLTQTQAYPEFARGDSGMILESSALQGSFQKGAQGKWDLRAAAMPAFPGKTAAPTNSGAALFVLSNDPAKQRAAWEFIKFLTSEQTYTMISSKIGYLPLRTGLVNDPDGLKAWAEQNPLLQPNLEQLSRLQPAVALPGLQYQQIRDGMMDAVEQVVFQGADADSTLRTAQQQASKLLPNG